MRLTGALGRRGVTVRSYRIPLWHEDRLLVVILAWTTILSSWLWWVPIRCMIEGAPFEWANEFGQGRLMGKGMGGDFLVLLLLSCLFISIVYLGWRGAQAPFKPMLLLWTTVNLATTMIIVLDDPAQYRFRGDTMGVDINMAWFMPGLKGDWSRWCATGSCATRWRRASAPCRSGRD